MRVTRFQIYADVAHNKDRQRLIIMFRFSRTVKNL